MSASLVGWLAFACIIIVSAWRTHLNAGLLALAAAVGIGGGLLGMDAERVLTFFPTGLFLNILGITLLFGMAQRNGTLPWLVDAAIHASGRYRAAVPLLLFLLISVVTAVGAGNIAATALIAPAAMAYAGRARLGALAMTILVVGGANAAALSPLTPTGLIVERVLGRMDPALFAPLSVSTVGWRVAVLSMALQGLLCLGGFLFFGGWRWMRSAPSDGVAAHTPPASDRVHHVTAAVLAAFVILVLAVSIPVIRGLLPLALVNTLGGAGVVGLLCAALLMVLGAADLDDTLRAVPWGTLVLVCGMGVLLDIMRAAGGLTVPASALARMDSTTETAFWFAFAAAVLSAFSSSSGVVLPAMLPMVPETVAALHGMDATALVTAISVGAHFTDTSPLSSLGALCVASAAPSEDKRLLFRNLLAWGLAMAPVGAAACALVLG